MSGRRSDQPTKGHEPDKEFSDPKSDLNVINNSDKTHYRTASEGFPERLKNLKLP
jgi:hypothetical protein